MARKVKRKLKRERDEWGETYDALHANLRVARGERDRLAAENELLRDQVRELQEKLAALGVKD